MKKRIIIKRKAAPQLKYHCPPYQPAPHEPKLMRGDNRIGRGTYGTVYDKYNDPHNVVKIIDQLPTGDFEDTLDSSALREISSYVLLANCPGLPKLDQVCLSDQRARFSLEKFDYSLASVIHKRRASEQTVKQMLTQMLHTLAVLEDHNIFHRDIKPSNILVKCGEDGSIRYALCDFGIAKFGNTRFTNQITGNVQTLWYRAPEILTYQVSRSDKTHYELDKIDIWSLGIIALEMLQAKFVAVGDDERNHLRKLKKLFAKETRNLQLMLNNHMISSELMEVLNLMTQLEPADRPNAISLLEHPYFKGETSFTATSELMRLERVNALYQFNPMHLQPHLDYRKSVLGILSTIKHDYELFTSPEVIYTALEIMDLAISKQPTLPEHWSVEKMAVGLYSLATKLQEPFHCEVGDLLSEFNLTLEEIKQVEIDIFTMLDYMLFIPSVRMYYCLIHQDEPPSQLLTKILESNRTLSHQELAHLCPNG